MKLREFFEPLAHWRSARAAAPLAGSASQRLQRVQIGLFGLVCMIILIGLADIVIRRAQLTEQSVAPPVGADQPLAKAASRTDPLAEAGVVPGLADTSEARQRPPAAPAQSGTRPATGP